LRGLLLHTRRDIFRRDFEKASGKIGSRGKAGNSGPSAELPVA
jgi:hypothetical protein